MDIYSDRADARVSAVEAPLWDIQVTGIASISQRRNLGLRHKGIWALDQNPPLLSPVQHPKPPCRQPVGLWTHGHHVEKTLAAPPGPSTVRRGEGSGLSFFLPSQKRSDCPGPFSHPGLSLPHSLLRCLRITGVPLVTRNRPQSQQTALLC